MSHHAQSGGRGAGGLSREAPCGPELIDGWGQERACHGQSEQVPEMGNNEAGVLTSDIQTDLD